MKSITGPGDVRTTTGAEDVSLPRFAIMAIDGKLTDDDVLKPSTMLLPNARVVPEATRSGEIAPLNA